jgi:hypothetical protein
VRRGSDAELALIAAVPADRDVCLGVVDARSELEDLDTVLDRIDRVVERRGGDEETIALSPNQGFADVATHPLLSADDQSQAVHVETLAHVLGRALTLGHHHRTRPEPGARFADRRGGTVARCRRRSSSVTRRLRIHIVGHDVWLQTLLEQLARTHPYWAQSSSDVGRARVAHREWQSAGGSRGRGIRRRSRKCRRAAGSTLLALAHLSHRRTCGTVGDMQ